MDIAVKLAQLSTGLMYNEGAVDSDGYYSELSYHDVKRKWDITMPFGYVTILGLPWKHKLHLLMLRLAYQIGMND